MPELSLILEGIFTLLLIAVLVYAMRLNKTIGGLKNDKSELEALLKTFVDATIRAETAIARMKLSVQEHDGHLEDQFAKAQKLKADLEDLMRHGQGRVADAGRLGGRPQIGASRDEILSDDRVSGYSAGVTQASTSVRDKADFEASLRDRLKNLEQKKSTAMRNVEASEASEEIDTQDERVKLREKSKAELLNALKGVR
jgi:phage shock protein A